MTQLNSDSEVREAWQDYRHNGAQQVTVYLPRAVREQASYRVARPLRGAEETKIWLSVLHGYPWDAADLGWNGGYTTSADKSQYSLHHWGVATDWDARNNDGQVTRRRDRGGQNWPHGWQAAELPEGDKIVPSTQTYGTITRFSPAFVQDLVRITTDGEQVWQWGGHWNTVTDSMHIETQVDPGVLLRNGVDLAAVPNLDHAFTYFLGQVVSGRAPVLGDGDNGITTLLVQRATGATEDGLFGPNTAKAVEELQNSHGLNPDGVVGAGTWPLIVSALTNTTPPEPGPDPDPERVDEHPWRVDIGDGARVYTGVLVKLRGDGRVRTLPGQLGESGRFVQAVAWTGSDAEGNGTPSDVLAVSQVSWAGKRPKWPVLVLPGYPLTQVRCSVLVAG